MSLQDHDINLIIQDFPKFELSYETMTHNKVHNADIMLAIPEGKKCFAWFTSYKEDNVCFVLQINDNKQIEEVKIVTTSFDDKLALGTIFYGTMFQYNDINCFSIEDLYYYKGKYYNQVQYSNKLDTLITILKNEMSQNVLIKNFTIFGLPLMSNDFNLMLKEIQLLPYKISQIKFRFFDKNNSRKILFIKYYKPGSQSQSQSQYSDSSKGKNILTKAVFKVTVDIEPDIYNLFIYKNGSEEYYDIAFIPDYKTSVMMNQLFRNIKENENLDAIEESDDEIEFQDTRDDKYVYLDRSFKINCEFNHKFKRWIPVSLANKNDRIISSNYIK